MSDRTAEDEALQNEAAELKEQVATLTAERDILRGFYWKVADLTLNHDVRSDAAVVYADKLGVLLNAIDPTWYFKPKMQFLANQEAKAAVIPPKRLHGKRKRSA